MKKALAAILAALASLLLLAVRHLEQQPAAAAPPAVVRPAVEATHPAPQERHDGETIRPSLGDAGLDRQVALVIASMDATGRPPAGVEQGGRRGGARGVFQNLERRLPAQPPGYYTETDVWPRGGSGRGTRRLIFGRGGEVYYTGDHYRTFVKVR
jgi:guanyl-specific ribonuclease Sa